MILSALEIDGNAGQKLQTILIITINVRPINSAGHNMDKRTW